MTHVRYDVFCSSYWKKDVEFWLLTLEARDFIHSWTCQTEERIQAITDECVNRPAVHPSKVTPWQLYSVWDCSLCHPQSFASCLFSPCQNDWALTSCFQLIMVRGVASLLIYFAGLCYWEFRVSSQWGWLADSSADLFPWQLPDSTATQIACLQWHKQTLRGSTAFKIYALLSQCVCPYASGSAGCFEREALDYY